MACIAQHCFWHALCINPQRCTDMQASGTAEPWRAACTDYPKRTPRAGGTAAGGPQRGGPQRAHRTAASWWPWAGSCRRALCRSRSRSSACKTRQGWCTPRRWCPPWRPPSEANQTEHSFPAARAADDEPLSPSNHRPEQQALPQRGHIKRHYAVRNPHNVRLQREQLHGAHSRAEQGRLPIPHTLHGRAVKQQVLLSSCTACRRHCWHRRRPCGTTERLSRTLGKLVRPHTETQHAHAANTQRPEPKPLKDTRAPA